MRAALRIGLFALAAAAAFAGGALTSACQARSTRAVEARASVGRSTRPPAFDGTAGMAAAAVLFTPSPTTVRGATSCAK